MNRHAAAVGCLGGGVLLAVTALLLGLAPLLALFAVLGLLAAGT